MQVKTILIAGSSGGLGQAIQDRFRAGGYDVIAVSRHGAGHTHVDLSDAHATAELFNGLDPSKPLAGVIHNAMQFHRSAFLETEPETFEQVWRSMTLTAVNVAQQAIPLLRTQGGGCLIFSGASGSLRAEPHFSAFSSAKFALRGLAQGLAREHGSEGIHVVHTILDGLIWSDKTQQRFSSAQQRRSMIPTDLAEVYWQLFHQPQSTWTQELDLRPQGGSY
ncbi:SDR family NAD(P)-dependent oxidoreductase [Collimonas sp.]|jgi:NAD(P)-dependent dehydrogenase (short-subunit alcohol dehydrogenase family)|uniref:SDR family NAD(P)-dependent oxidoreductase n=1 Tax=Collimonas sp. TaxID=1963772 RepID=UPI0037BECBD2